MIESICKCLYLLLTLADLAVKLITIALKLFLLLSGFNNVVGL
jgi:hypothetical protein